MIIITSKKDGFRRCGIAHLATPTEYPDGAFTDEQIEALHNEPMLVVNQGIEVPVGQTGRLPGAAADMIALAKKVGTVEALAQLVEGETRKAVLDAIAARRQELEA